jgi:hypothetical protein
MICSRGRKGWKGTGVGLRREVEGKTALVLAGATHSTLLLSVPEVFSPGFVAAASEMIPVAAVAGSVRYA